MGYQEQQELKERLARRLAERKKIIEQIVSGVRNVIATSENCKKDNSEEAVYELEHIGDFSFRVVYGKGLRGHDNNTISIWPAHCVEAPCNPPLIITWRHDSEDYTVRGDDEFISQIPGFINQIPAILANLKQRAAEQQEDLNQLMEDKEFVKLVERAEKLGMEVLPR
jgi:hypothetical protein